MMMDDAFAYPQQNSHEVTGCYSPNCESSTLIPGSKNGGGMYRIGTLIKGESIKEMSEPCEDPRFPSVYSGQSADYYDSFPGYDPNDPVNNNFNFGTSSSLQGGPYTYGSTDGGGFLFDPIWGGFSGTDPLTIPYDPISFTAYNPPYDPASFRAVDPSSSTSDDEDDTSTSFAQSLVNFASELNLEALSDHVLSQAPGVINKVLGSSTSQTSGQVAQSELGQANSLQVSSHSSLEDTESSVDKSVLLNTSIDKQHSQKSGSVDLSLKVAVNDFNLKGESTVESKPILIFTPIKLTQSELVSSEYYPILSDNELEELYKKVKKDKNMPCVFLSDAIHKDEITLDDLVKEFHSSRIRKDNEAALKKLYEAGIYPINEAGHSDSAQPKRVLIPLEKTESSWDLGPEYFILGNGRTGSGSGIVDTGSIKEESSLDLESVYFILPNNGEGRMSNIGKGSIGDNIEEELAPIARSYRMSPKILYGPNVKTKIESLLENSPFTTEFHDIKHSFNKESIMSKYNPNHVYSVGNRKDLVGNHDCIATDEYCKNTCFPPPKYVFQLTCYDPCLKDPNSGEKSYILHFNCLKDINSFINNVLENVNNHDHCPCKDNPKPVCNESKGEHGTSYVTYVKNSPPCGNTCTRRDPISHICVTHKPLYDPSSSTKCAKIEKKKNCECLNRHEGCKLPIMKGIENSYEPQHMHHNKHVCPTINTPCAQTHCKVRAGSEVVGCDKGKHDEKFSVTEHHINQFPSYSKHNSHPKSMPIFTVTNHCPKTYCDNEEPANCQCKSSDSNISYKSLKFPIEGKCPNFKKSQEICECLKLPTCHPEYSKTDNKVDGIIGIAQEFVKSPKIAKCESSIMTISKYDCNKLGFGGHSVDLSCVHGKCNKPSVENVSNVIGKRISNAIETLLYTAPYCIFKDKEVLPCNSKPQPENTNQACKPKHFEYNYCEKDKEGIFDNDSLGGKSSKLHYCQPKLTPGSNANQPSNPICVHCERENIGMAKPCHSKSQPENTNQACKPKHFEYNYCEKDKEGMFYNDSLGGKSSELHYCQPKSPPGSNANQPSNPICIHCERENIGMGKPCHTKSQPENTSQECKPKHFEYNYCEKDKAGIVDNDALERESSKLHYCHQGCHPGQSSGNDIKLPPPLKDDKLHYCHQGCHPGQSSGNDIKPTPLLKDDKLHYCHQGCHPGQSSGNDIKPPPLLKHDKHHDCHQGCHPGQSSGNDIKPPPLLKDDKLHYCHQGCHPGQSSGNDIKPPPLLKDDKLHYCHQGCHPGQSSGNNIKPPPLLKHDKHHDCHQGCHPGQSSGNDIKPPPLLKHDKHHDCHQGCHPGKSSGNDIKPPPLLKHDKHHYCHQGCHPGQSSGNDIKPPPLLKHDKHHDCHQGCHPGQSSGNDIKPPPLLKHDKHHYCHQGCHPRQSSGNDIKPPPLLKDDKHHNKIHNMNSCEPKNKCGKVNPASCITSDDCETLLKFLENVSVSLDKGDKCKENHNKGCVCSCKNQNN